MKRPSGDHSGCMLDLRALVSWRSSDPPVAIVATQISVSYSLSSQLVSRRVYATRWPSGSIAGAPTRLRLSRSSIVGAGVCAVATGQLSATASAAAAAVDRGTYHKARAGCNCSGRDYAVELTLVVTTISTDEFSWTLRGAQPCHHEESETCARCCRSSRPRPSLLR
jgi:hypothetical protein